MAIPAVDFLDIVATNAPAGNVVPDALRTRDDLHLVVLIFALNEEPTVANLIRRVPRKMPRVGRVDVIVIDDGSTDRTAVLAREAGAKVVSHGRNLGVGAALATGIDAGLRAGADVIVHLDGDGQFNPEDIPTLIKPILEQGYGFATTTRFSKPELVPKMPIINRLGNRAVAWCVRWVLWGTHFTDVLCGFRAYSRETALRLMLFSRFTYTQETLIDAAAKGIRIAEVPLVVRGVREFGKSRMTANVLWYGVQVGAILLRAMRDVRPLLFFGLIAAALVGVGLTMLGIGAVLAVEASMLPYRVISVVIYGGVTSAIAGVTIGATAMVADQIGRTRRIEEEARYLARLAYYGQFRRGTGVDDVRQGEGRPGESLGSR